MVHRTRALALAAGLAVALPATAAGAQAAHAGPVAHAAGSGAPPPDPAVVGVPIQRTAAALSGAADAIDAGNGAGAAAALTASRRYLLRSYAGAKYLIALPPPPATDAGARVTTRKFVTLAKKAVRTSHSRAAGKGGWITAHASGGAVGPVFADGPTAVFDVFTSQYGAATGAVGMAPDATGQLLAKVKTTLNTAIVLRNRLVKIIAAAAPPATQASVKAHASGGAVTTFDVVMPGLTVLLDDEMQQMTAASADPSVPAESKAMLATAIAADTQIETLVNQTWPPAAP